jgi:hypothetical protein
MDQSAEESNMTSLLYADHTGVAEDRCDAQTTSGNVRVSCSRRAHDTGLHENSFNGTWWWPKYLSGSNVCWEIEEGQGPGQVCSLPQGHDDPDTAPAGCYFGFHRRISDNRTWGSEVANQRNRAQKQQNAQALASSGFGPIVQAMVSPDRKILEDIVDTLRRIAMGGDVGSRQIALNHVVDKLNAIEQAITKAAAVPPNAAWAIAGAVDRLTQAQQQQNDVLQEILTAMQTPKAATRPARVAIRKHCDSVTVRYQGDDPAHWVRCVRELGHSHLHFDGERTWDV